MKNLISKFSPLFLLILLISCSHDHQKVAGVGPIDRGRLLKGENFYLEVIGDNDEVKIYPLKKEKNSEKFVLIPLKQIEVDASYSFPKVGDEGTRNGPSSKGEDTIDLHREGNALVGEVKAQEVDMYALKMKVKYKEDKESFLYNVEL